MTTELRGVLAARASSRDGADEDEATISYRRSDACLIAFAYVPAVLFFIENAFEMCLGGQELYSFAGGLPTPPARLNTASETA